MKCTVLGSGAWEGIPAPFCTCGVCTDAQRTDPKNTRSRPQLFVETDAGYFIIEASPDIRLQSSRFSLPPIRDFVISHWHPDHMAGLRELDAYGAETIDGIQVHCSTGTKAVLETAEYSYLPMKINIRDPFASFSLAGVTITPFPTYHMRSQDDTVAEDQLANTFGYLLEHEGKRIAYLSDYYRLGEKSKALIRGADIIICDGTYLLTDDYRDRKTNHMHGADITDFADSLGTKQVYYHSVSHLTHKTHEEIQSELPSSHKLTYDGLIIGSGQP